METVILELPKMQVVVGGYCTQILADGKLISYMDYEDVHEGVRCANFYRTKLAFVYGVEPDTTPIPILMENSRDGSGTIVTSYPERRRNFWRRFTDFIVGNRS